MPLIKTTKEKVGTILFWSMIVVLLLGLATVDHCFKGADKTAEKVQQTKDDGKIIEIDGLKWRRSTFFDEYGRCWKIYTSSALRAGEIHGQKSFATKCPKEK